MKRFLLLLTLLMTLILPVFVWGAAPVGQITGLNGQTFVRSKAGLPYTALAKGADVNVGTWLKTGPEGWIELTLNDRSKFTLANNTEFEVTNFLLTDEKREGNFRLTEGKFRASVVKFGGRQSGMTVKSSTAVAGIKGTEFMMLSQGQANLFFGNYGTVSISGDGSGNEQPLTAATFVQNTRSLPPAEPFVVEQGSPLAEAKGIFDGITAAQPPEEWTDSGQIADICARWNINHGHYMADSGKYNDALNLFQIALDLTKIEAVRADAHMERGAVYARFLDNPEQALAEYLLVLEQYPALPQAEFALFNAAQVLSELGLIDQARQRFQQYLKKYPNGKQRNNARTLLKNLKR